jgi:tetratricopeptide (TPR) repeat protein
MDDEHDPGQEPDLRLSGVAGLQRTVDALLAVGQNVRAKELTMDFIAAAPDDPYGHLALARILAAEGHTREALDTVEGALARAPDDDQVHLHRGGLLLELGRWAEAEEAMRRSIELDPGWAPSHAAYAQLLSACDRDVEALQRTEHALALDPDLPWLHTLRARLMLFVHPRHWTVSEDAVRTALRMDPESAHAHAILGLVLLRAGRNEESEEAFRAALRLQPGDPLALRGLSELVKGRSPLYRPMLWFGQLMSRLGTDGQLGVLFGLWALYAGAQALLPEGNQSASDLLTAVYFGFCAYTWFAEPITRAILRRHYPWLE